MKKTFPILFIILFCYIGISMLLAGIKTGESVTYIIGISFLILSIIVILFMNSKFKASFLIFLLLLISIGLCFVYSGGVTTYKTTILTNGFVSTPANFVSKEYYDTVKQSSGKRGYSYIDRYNVVYTYIVNDKEYYIKNLEAVNTIGFTEEKVVKYNSNDPNNSIIVGKDGGVLQILFGAMFVIIPGIFINILFLKSKRKNSSGKKNSNIFVFCTLIIIGGIAYCIMSNQTFSIINAYKASGLLILFPLIFLFAGILGLLHRIYYKNRPLLLKLECVEIIDNYEYEGKRYFLVILEKGQRLIDKILLKNRYSYLTKDKSKFEVGNKYIVDIFKYSICTADLLDRKDINKGILLDKSDFKNKDFEII